MNIKTYFKYQGKYIYRIFVKDNPAITVYIGACNNIYNRYYCHFANFRSYVMNSAFHNFCLSNSLNKNDYGIEVLDLSNCNIDNDDLFLLEKAYIRYYEPLLNKRNKSRFNSYELEQLDKLMLLTSNIDFVPYSDLITKKKQ